MIRRIREFQRNENTGITIPVGVVALWATWSVIQGFVAGFIYPLVAAVFENDDDFARPLEFSVGSADLSLDTLLISGVSALILFTLIHYVFVRPIDADYEPERGMRECPECRSEIVIDATRCPFCTASVAPVDLETEAEY